MSIKLFNEQIVSGTSTDVDFKPLVEKLPVLNMFKDANKGCNLMNLMVKNSEDAALRLMLFVGTRMSTDAEYIKGLLQDSDPLILFLNTWNSILAKEENCLDRVQAVVDVRDGRILRFEIVKLLKSPETPINEESKNEGK